MFEDNEAQLAETIAEYERLRKLMRDLDAQAGQVDQQLITIERTLPGEYTYAGDMPLGPEPQASEPQPLPENDRSRFWARL